MYSNHFCAAVFVDGSPLPEKHSGSVNIAIGTEWSLRLYNKNGRRAVVRFTVDGEAASGRGYIIEAQSHIDIKRYHDRDAAFKFVTADSKLAKQAGKSGPDPECRRGVIEASFWLEKRAQPYYLPYVPVPPYIHIVAPQPQPYWPPIHKPFINPREIWCSGFFGFEPNLVSASSLGHSDDGGLKGAPEREEKTCGRIFGTNTASAPLDGCTVHGGSTGQNFGTGYCDIEGEPTIIRLLLRGFNPGPDASNKGVPVYYCPGCGRRRLRTGDRFCGGCGRRLPAIDEVH